jgi:hypothetical protein
MTTTLAEKMRFRIGYSPPQLIEPALARSLGVQCRYRISEPSIAKPRLYHRLPQAARDDLPAVLFVNQLFGRLTGIVATTGPWGAVRINGKGLVIGMTYSPELADKLCSKT